MRQSRRPAAHPGASARRTAKCGFFIIGFQCQEWHGDRSDNVRADRAGRQGLESLLHGCGALRSDQSLTLQILLGWLLAPHAWIMGVPWADAPAVGALLGIKTVANEFVAFFQLAGILAGDTALAPRSIVIATYALVGFANFGSIAIQIGGIGSIAPSRRSDLARIGLRAMIGGSLAAFLTATIAGILL